MIILYKKTIHTKVITLLHEKKKMHKVMSTRTVFGPVKQIKQAVSWCEDLNNFTVGHVIYYDTLNILKTLNDLYEVVLRAD